VGRNAGAQRRARAGLYADGSCWGGVIERLHSAGLRVTSVQNPLRTFEQDVAAAGFALAMQDGPTVLVAHSYGGMVVTQAGVVPNVCALVYVAARAPDAGENYAALAAKFPTPPVSSGLVVRDGLELLGESAFLNDFANGVEPAKAQLLFAVQAANAVALPATAKTTVAAWRSKPSWYAVSRQDRTIDPDLERERNDDRGGRRAPFVSQPSGADRESYNECRRARHVSTYDVFVAKRVNAVIEGTT
jgi:pimeloyl-ACP methyl ester carboxylesterase